MKAVPSVKATSGDEAVSHARELGYPVAMKVISPDTLHKSDAGGVMLNVCGPEEVRTCFGTIRKTSSSTGRRPPSRVRMQKMAPEGHDMFVGGKHDPSFGPVVFFGMGGIYIEVFRDVAMPCVLQPEIVLERVRGSVIQGAAGPSRQGPRRHRRLRRSRRARIDASLRLS